MRLEPKGDQMCEQVSRKGRWGQPRVRPGRSREAPSGFKRYPRGAPGEAQGGSEGTLKAANEPGVTPLRALGAQGPPHGEPEGTPKSPNDTKMETKRLTKTDQKLLSSTRYYLHFLTTPATPENDNS